MKRDLISIKGLQERFGRTGPAVREKMNRKGAPDEVAVEGLRATQVFDTEEAVRYLEESYGWSQVDRT